ncbi:hypothetical protein SAMN05216326_11849 [Nitrosomonas marina]|uniref:Uncharacterized protein n=1 Tax=Nitrosomonas marina TaxID=917 RepID=A0A1I0D7H9_9PROT|nr:hypothetical protein SAMN05216326_11849 [Nitrosomonas marina]
MPCFGCIGAIQGNNSITALNKMGVENCKPLDFPYITFTIYDYSSGIATCAQTSD